MPQHQPTDSNLCKWEHHDISLWLFQKLCEEKLSGTQFDWGIFLSCCVIKNHWISNHWMKNKIYSLAIFQLGHTTEYIFQWALRYSKRCEWINVFNLLIRHFFALETVYFCAALTKRCFSWVMIYFYIHNCMVQLFPPLVVFWKTIFKLKLKRNSECTNVLFFKCFFLSSSSSVCCDHWSKISVGYFEISIWHVCHAVHKR